MSGQIDIENLARNFKWLVLWFGVQLLMPVGQLVLPVVPGSPVDIVNAVVLVVALATLVALAYYGARTAAALGSSVGWLWGLAMFFPCVNVITLLGLSTKATATCRAAGMRVGLLGPKLRADGSFEKLGEGELEVHQPDWTKIGP